jgi:putative ATP-dependent endonuclease of OLD family
LITNWATSLRVYALSIENFRGIRSAKLTLPDHAVLIGDNNTGKTSILEAIDLVLGPDRLNRRPPVDEHDFFESRYLAASASTASEDAVPAEAEALPAAEAPKITIEVTITDLSEDQLARFGDNIEWLDIETGSFFTEPNPAGVDAEEIKAALRVTFIGAYDADEDDFVGNTFFSRSLTEGEKPAPFSKKDKQNCGFLFLRSLRTGSRALSLDHGSLLDIILRLKEIRPRMWEGTISKLAEFDVAGDPAIGISGVLESIDKSLKKYVPREWGVNPRLKVSNLTRESLRKVVTAFIATGDGDHAAPFFRQGTEPLRVSWSLG